MLDPEEERMRIDFLFVAVAIVLFTSCSERKESSNGYALFNLMDPQETRVHFVNQLDYTEEINTYTFKNFYNGGGVGIGDFNNDSLPDVFFTGNMVSNKLFLNEGKMTFRDITASAGLESAGSWSTGVSVVDINGDGWLDIYVCKSGPPDGRRRHNELFINQGNLTFTEESARYALDFVGLSTHAAFFDYDKDGDLDCYLLNNSIRSIGAYDLRKDQRKIPDAAGGNKLLRNDNGIFTDVSQKANIYTSMIGFGLGVSIGDINQDGWPDIYVSNDFFEKDYLYLNQQDGTFRESLEDMLREISLGSMGADMADINNDGLPEIFVTEMLPATDDRLKTTTQFENWDKYAASVSKGYYHQFSRNVLQHNNGDGTFSEISRFSGIHASDWSWGALIMDMDQDGYKDIFVANGIYKDLLDQDYVNFVSNDHMVRQILNSKGAVIKQLIDSIPTNRIGNFAFRNQGDLTFQNKSSGWGLGEPTHSNGAAYADLDNDGDLDLVINNVNMPAHIYKNQATAMHPEHNNLSLALSGNDKNAFALGAKVWLHAGGKTFYQEHFPTRGFMSSVDYKLVFGLGKIDRIDSLIVEWPDDRRTMLKNVEANQFLTLNQSDATIPVETNRKTSRPLLREISLPGTDFRHVESEFVDFDRDRLLFNMISNEGPCLCVGDINLDGLEDFFVGGAKGQAGNLYLQQEDGQFLNASPGVFASDSRSEDTDCAFFDANNDGKLDLYVASGSNEFSSSSSALLDRLYINTGNNNFEKDPQLFPTHLRFESTSTVEPIDFDSDGDIDLFVGVRMIPGYYGVPCNGYLLRNDGSGRYTDATSDFAPDLRNLGMIRDAAWTDINNDSFPDLIVVGEWMEIQAFVNRQGKSLEKIDAGFGGTEGWYNTVEIADLNGDGFMDIVVGNHGLNSRFRATETEPLHLYVNDFDQNGSIEHITTRFYEGTPLPLVLRQDLVSQIPELKKKYLHFESYTGQKITDIFDADQMERAMQLNAFRLETSVWLNTGDGTFHHRPLPAEAQFSPVYAVYIDDIDGDANPDIILGGNLYRAKPETGIYDGSYGLFLKGDGRGEFSAIRPAESGISVRGEVRDIKGISTKKGKVIIISRNNDKLKFYSY